MSDLVERLRAAHYPPFVTSDMRPITHHAADRIEALEAERDRLRGALRQIYDMKLEDTEIGYEAQEVALTALGCKLRSMED